MGEIRGKASERCNHSYELLVVDDDGSTRKLVARSLQRRGYEVRTASDGLEGVEKFSAHGADLALVDLDMPGIDGFEAVRRMRQSAGDDPVPLIILTGSEHEDAVRRAFDAGATDFVVKPVNVPLIAQRVRYALAAAEGERRLRRINMEQQSACGLARLGFWRLDLDTEQLYWSEGAAEMIGWAQRGMPDGLDALEALLPDCSDRRRLRGTLDAAVRGEPTGSCEITLGEGDERRLLVLNVTPGTDRDALVGAFQDVTDLRNYERQMHELVYYDELTGLPRERLFGRMHAEKIERARESGHILAVLVIDIDRLQRINEGFGTRAGDQILRDFGNRLRGVLPSDGLICRLEADAFALCCTIVDEVQGLENIRQRLGEVLSRSYSIDGQEIAIGYSAGAALFPVDRQKPKELIRSAQRAQREARDQAASEFARYDAAWQERVDQRLILEAELSRALDRKEFRLVFQPKQSLHGGQVYGAEALLRWEHRERGLISPAEFIPILEETGMIQDVGAWGLEEAFRQIREWRSRGLDLEVSINLSAVQIESQDVAAMLDEMASRYGIPPQSVELEITESAVMRDPEFAIVLLRRLRESGFGVAIDDFGTGYSSMEYLLRLPVTTLKIDKAFIHGITCEHSARGIVMSLTTLCWSMGLHSIAEGVETPEQRKKVHDLGVDAIQGFLLGKPEFAEQFIQRFGFSENLGGGSEWK